MMTTGRGLAFLCFTALLFTLLYRWSNPTLPLDRLEPESSLYAVFELTSDSGVDWFMEKVSDVAVDGCQLTSHNPLVRVHPQQAGWDSALVPGSVLADLARNQRLPDPYFDMNNEKIVDAYQHEDLYTYWNYVSFTTPTSVNLSSPVFVWLDIDGINYSADLYLNGRKINKNPMIGMFLAHSFDISSHITPTFGASVGTNRLALALSPPTPAGNATNGQGGDGQIARSVTAQFKAGWDWIIPTRDRSTGIWRPVRIRTSGPIALSDPHVTSSVATVQCTRSPCNVSSADVSISATVQCLASHLVRGILQVTLVPLREPSMTVTHATPVLSFEGHATVPVSINASIDNPYLWWTNGLGSADLYNVTLELIYMPDDTPPFLSDAHSLLFGIRNLTSDIYQPLDGGNPGRRFLVNSVPVFITGANWISADAMMQSAPIPVETQVHMHAVMGMNMIRVWGGGVSESNEFYDACDRYGLLVFQEFWITGDCNGAWDDPSKQDSKQRRRAYPDSHSLFLASARSNILRIRNHASLAIWCGGNEYPAPSDLLDGLHHLVRTLDSQRLLINSSLSSGFGPGDGPYGIQYPSWFFRSRDKNSFNPELGSVGMVEVESLRMMMKEKSLYPLGNNNTVWAYHKFIAYNNFAGGDGDEIVLDQVNEYGVPATVEQYCEQAQLVNYVQYQSLFASRILKMWESYTGTMLWKSQNPWPGLRGQLYDYWGDYTGGFFGTKLALKPISVIFDFYSYNISVANRLGSAQSIELEYILYNVSSDAGSVIKAAHTTHSRIISENSVADILSTPFQETGALVLQFLQLRLKSTTQHDVRAMYWFANGRVSNPEHKFELLSHLSEIALQVQCERGPSLENGHATLILEIRNLSETMLAWFIRIQLIDSESSLRILPSLYSDNYISLIPIESRSVTITTHQGDSASIRTSGRNVASIVTACH